MIDPFYAFIGLLLVTVGSVGWFLRDTIRDLRHYAERHAKTYAVAYVKGGALVLIAAGASFDETFKGMTKAAAVELPWWAWVSLFWKPIGAGLAVIVAFLDRSAQRASESKTTAINPNQP